MMAMRTVDQFFEQQPDLTIEDVAEQSGLLPERVEAIAMGRWTPSPLERRTIAEVLGVSVEDISWGHTMDPRNIRYRQFGFEQKARNVE